MQLYPATPVFLVLLALCVIGGPRRLLILLSAMLPFGMFAALSLPAVGGLSILAVNLTAAVLAGFGALALIGNLMRGRSITVEPAAIALLLFTAYAIFSATVLVRLFAGEMMVFPLSRNETGVRVSVLFSWGKVWLGPTSSNISQTFYVALACGFFIAACRALAAQGAAFGGRCMAVAASVNIALGSLDLAGLDDLLSYVRTANYTLANSASVNGLARIIGGYSEAASFGTASAVFYAYFASAATNGGRRTDTLLAAGSALCTVLALSSTGLIALAVTTLLLAIRGVARLPSRVTAETVLRLVAGLLTMALTTAAVLLLTDAPDIIMAVLDDLIFEKSSSSSGQERMAWSLGGLAALRDTWGLGAGTGSIRSNGLVFVLLGSVGLPGTALFAAFLWLAFAGRAAPGQEAHLSNARLAAVAVLVSMLLAATVPDPGVPLILLAAIAVTARRARPEPALRSPVLILRRPIFTRSNPV
ncbi:hypothetical protein [Jannaschia marina]|uniref:hypothetical protein n=1 Tax=Jannaschia marina TaxID=2741674 RepID=UPI0015C808CC|nr:hypothetical protein [Jannaschia marina]